MGAPLTSSEATALLRRWQLNDRPALDDFDRDDLASPLDPGDDEDGDDPREYADN